MKYKTKNRVSYIIVFLLLVFVVGIVVFMIQGSGGTSVGGMRVSVNGRNVGNGSELVLKINEPMEFTVEDLFGSKLEDYTVSILPVVTGDNDFDVIAGRDVYKFSRLKDLSKGFQLSIESGKFTLTNVYEMDGILSQVFGQEVVISRDVDFYAIPYLKINITFGSNTVYYMLKLGGYPDKIEFDKAVIVF